MLLKSGLFLTLCLFTLQASRIKGKVIIFSFFWGIGYCLCGLDKEMFAAVVVYKSERGCS